MYKEKTGETLDINILEKFNWKDRTKFKLKYINQLLQEDLLAMTISEKPNSSKQKYHTTQKGIGHIK
ncbi:MAG: hypothetical protein FVQ77_10880 [Cytophagales bacterium]|nr:hypothetical protein [Cytophagales bacterium]